MAKKRGSADKKFGSKSYRRVKNGAPDPEDGMLDELRPRPLRATRPADGPVRPRLKMKSPMAAIDRFDHE